MRIPLLEVGDFKFEEIHLNKGLIGGKIFATNKNTGEEISRSYKKFHTGKTNKWDVLTNLVIELIPPPPKDEVEAENS